MTVGGNLFFLLDAQVRFILPDAYGIFNGSQCVEHDSMRHLPPGLEIFTGNAGNPVVAEDDIIMQIILLTKVLYCAGEIRSVGIDQQLIRIPRFSGLYVDLPGARGKIDYLGSDRVFDAGIDVHAVSLPGQFTGQFPDVNTHTPGISRSGLAQR